MTDEARRRAELAALIEKAGWMNTPFSRCSYCGKDWNDGVGHEHGQGEMDPDPPYGFILVHEDKGGTIKFAAEKAADAVLAYVAGAMAQATRVDRERINTLEQAIREHTCSSTAAWCARCGHFHVSTVGLPLLCAALRREPQPAQPPPGPPGGHALQFLPGREPETRQP